MRHGLARVMRQPEPGDDVPGVGHRDQRVLPDAIRDQPEREPGEDGETDEGEQPAVDLPAADADRGGRIAHGVVHGPKPSRWPSGLGHPPIVRVVSDVVPDGSAPGMQHCPATPAPLEEPCATLDSSLRSSSCPAPPA